MVCSGWALCRVMFLLWLSSESVFATTPACHDLSTIWKDTQNFDCLTYTANNCTSDFEPSTYTRYNRNASSICCACGGGSRNPESNPCNSLVQNSRELTRLFQNTWGLRQGVPDVSGCLFDGVTKSCELIACAKEENQNFRTMGSATLTCNTNINQLELKNRNFHCVDCVDLNGWRDSDGFTCADYERYELCTPQGGYGIGWINSTFSDYAFASYNKDGIDASMACCGCGGGLTTSTLIPTQITMQLSMNETITSPSTQIEMAMSPLWTAGDRQVKNSVIAGVQQAFYHLSWFGFAGLVEAGQAKNFKLGSYLGLITTAFSLAYSLTLTVGATIDTCQTLRRVAISYAWVGALIYVTGGMMLMEQKLKEDPAMQIRGRWSKDGQKQDSDVPKTETKTETKAEANANETNEQPSEKESVQTENTILLQLTDDNNDNNDNSDNDNNNLTPKDQNTTTPDKEPDNDDDEGLGISDSVEAEVIEETQSKAIKFLKKIGDYIVLYRGLEMSTLGLVVLLVAMVFFFSGCSIFHLRHELSLGGEAFQSSLTSSHTPDLAINGPFLAKNIPFSDNHMCSKTNPEVNPFWGLNFDDEYTVDNVVIRPCDEISESPVQIYLIKSHRNVLDSPHHLEVSLVPCGNQFVFLDKNYERKVSCGMQKASGILIQFKAGQAEETMTTILPPPTVWSPSNHIATETLLTSINSPSAANDDSIPGQNPIVMNVMCVCSVRVYGFIDGGRGIPVKSHSPDRHWA